MQSSLTIVLEDNLVAVDGLVKKFNLEGKLPEGVRALQWANGRGTVEYLDGRFPESIGSLAEYDKVIAKYFKMVKASSEVEEEDVEEDELLWILNSLKVADIEIFKLEDDNLDTSAWRSYRKELRGWDKHNKFPDKEYRPKSPKE